MLNEEKKENIEITETAEDAIISVEPSDIAVAGVTNLKDNKFENKDRKKNERRPSRRSDGFKQEFDSKIINVRRVTRVVSGGRRFSFSIAMVIGDKKGKVGIGMGKSADTPVAVDKAMRDAKKNMVLISLTDNKSIAHKVEAKYSSAMVSITPAPGKGVIAGSATRTVLELAGIKEISSKILSRSKNKLNIARATIKALSSLKTIKVRNNESKIS